MMKENMQNNREWKRRGSRAKGGKSIACFLLSPIVLHCP